MADAEARLRDLYVRLDGRVRDGGSDDQRRMLRLLDAELFGAEEGNA